MYCPAWIFEICVSRTAFEFLHSEMGLSAFANKYASGLSSIYETFESKNSNYQVCIDVDTSIKKKLTQYKKKQKNKKNNKKKTN